MRLEVCKTERLDSNQGGREDPNLDVLLSVNRAGELGPVTTSLNTELHSMIVKASPDTVAADWCAQQGSNEATVHAVTGAKLLCTP
jgi:hypothetical protein